MNVGFKHLGMASHISVILRVSPHLATMTHIFDVVSIIFYVIRNGLHGYQGNCSHMTTEKNIVVVKCEQTLTCPGILFVALKVLHGMFWEILWHLPGT